MGNCLVARGPWKKNNGNKLLKYDNINISSYYNYFCCRFTIFICVTNKVYNKNYVWNSWNLS